MRFFGVLLIFAAFSLVGMSLSLSMKKKLERLKLYRRMADDISTLIRYRSLTVREVMQQLQGCGAYSELCFMAEDFSDRTKPAGEIWKESVMKDSSLSDEEKKLLTQLGSQLGTTDSEGQLSIMAAFALNVDEMIERQAEKYAVKGKLCRSVGILGGAMVGIMII